MSELAITVLMPMGGLGQRFFDAGYTTPKPLIDVDGSPMFLRALESFPADWDIQSVFVVRKDHDERYDLKHLIKENLPTAQVSILENNTRGTVETCLNAAELIEPDEPVIIADCDIRFHSEEYCEKVESGRYDGMLVGFRSSDPRYSYAELDDAGLVRRTAEKVPISDHALLGGYYFGAGKLFLDIAHRFVEQGLSESGLKEFYVSHLYNMLLQDDKSIGYADVDDYDIWGTPEELQRYLNK